MESKMHNVDVDMSKLECVVLQHGKHDSPDRGMCFMEAIAWAYGGEFTDFPPCVPREIARLGQRINDAPIWESDEDRTETLRPFFALVLNASHSPEARTKRGYFAAHFAIMRASDAANSAKRQDIADRLSALTVPTSRAECLALRAAAQQARSELYDADAYSAYSAAYAAYAAAADAAAAAAAAADADAADAADAAYAAAADADAADAAADAKQARRSALLQLLKDFCEVKP